MFAFFGNWIGPSVVHLRLVSIGKCGHHFPKQRSSRGIEYRHRISTNQLPIGSVGKELFIAKTHNKHVKVVLRIGTAKFVERFDGSVRIGAQRVNRARN